MAVLLHVKRDLYAGGLMALVGAGAITEGMRLKSGTMTHMGPGFFPIVLGVILVFLGLLIASSGPHPIDEQDVVRLDLRGGACVLAGVLAFMLFGSAFGFAAATFSAVLISALGDRTAKLRESVLLATGMTVVGAVVFTRLLSIPFPLFRWF